MTQPERDPSTCVWVLDTEKLRRMLWEAYNGADIEELILTEYVNMDHEYIEVDPPRTIESEGKDWDPSLLGDDADGILEVICKVGIQICVVSIVAIIILLALQILFN